MPDILDEKNRVARKDHTCDYCGGIIKKGEEYNWAKLINEGRPYEWKAHKDCIMVSTALWDYVDPDMGMSEEDFFEATRDFCETFCCPECPKNHDTGDGTCEEIRCLDKVIEKLKTHDFKRIYKNGRPTCEFHLVPKEEKNA